MVQSHNLKLSIQTNDPTVIRHLFPQDVIRVRQSHLSTGRRVHAWFLRLQYSQRAAHLPHQCLVRVAETEDVCAEDLRELQSSMESVREKFRPKLEPSLTERSPRARE